MTYKIAFYNRKGGTGKTTSTINVAGELAKRGYKVLIIDSDAQGNASQNLGCYAPDKDSLSEVLLGTADVNDVIVSTEVDNIDILPATIELQETETKMLVAAGRTDNFMVKAMKKLNRAYDFILVDCSPSFGIMTTNMLSYVDYILVPVKVDKNSLEGYENLTQKVNIIREDSNENLVVLGLFLTSFEKGTTLDKEMFAMCKESFGDLFFDNVINKNVAVREAPMHAVPVNVYEGSSRGAVDYKALTDEILERLGE